MRLRLAATLLVLCALGAAASASSVASAAPLKPLVVRGLEAEQMSTRLYLAYTAANRRYLGGFRCSLAGHRRMAEQIANLEPRLGKVGVVKRVLRARVVGRVYIVHATTCDERLRMVVRSRSGRLYILAIRPGAGEIHVVRADGKRR